MSTIGKLRNTTSRIASKVVEYALKMNLKD